MLVSNRVNKALCYMIVVVDVVVVVVVDDDDVVVNVGIVFFLVQYILFDITMNLSDTFRSTISQFTSMSTVCVVQVRDTTGQRDTYINYTQ